MTTPYQAAARDYFKAGWSPLPLPPKQKQPVPTGFTGSLGAYVSEPILEAWLSSGARVTAGKMSFRPGNVALRLPQDVIGIDVDAYGDKTGEATLAAAEEAWGGLPRTWVTTSREDGLSGIRLFRIPTGLAWPGQLPQGGGVELIRWDHRFAIVAPSIHDKTGLPYRWWTEAEDGALVESDEFPTLADLLRLPKRWIQGLTNGNKWEERPIDESMDYPELKEWLSRRVKPDTPCEAMEKTIAKHVGEIRKAGKDGGAHDRARNSAWAVIGDSYEGHAGVESALGTLRKEFLEAVSGRRSDIGAAESEWKRIVLRGAQKVSAEGPPDDDDFCANPNKQKVKRAGRRGLNWEPLNELGNASRLVSVMAGRARWVEDWQSWVIWSDTDRIWTLDSSRQVERWAVKAIREMETEVGHITEEKQVKAYLAHIKSSLNVGKQRAMIEMARAREGIILPSNLFDANPRILPCGNGTVELNPDGVNFRESRQEDYATLRTSVHYKPEATNRMWADFLKRFVPNVEVRLWLQRLVGYSLLGINPARIMVILLGKTSTGKSTFLEALLWALGDLVAPMPASVFRDNIDDKPRPDLLEAFPKRIIAAEEVSQQIHLHADQIKRLTGGGRVTARGMRANRYQSRIPAFTPWLAANNPPAINGADVAIYRRLLAVPFNVQIPYGKETPTFAADLKMVAAETILAWAVAGYAMYANDPSQIWEIPSGAARANAELRESMSDVDVFISEACERGPEHRIRPDALYELYESWCSRSRVASRDVLSATKFGREVEAKGFSKKQVKIAGKPTWFRVGLAAKDSKVIASGSGEE